MTQRGGPGRAVVVGAGIGGLAAARALVGAGWDVEVRERLDDPWDQGSGISIWPNALRALDVLGCGDAVRDVGLVQAAGGVRDRRGRWLVRTDNRVMVERQGDGITVLPRSRLLAILRDALPAGVVRTGAPVTDPARLDADLVVGADGIGSAVRPLVDPRARVRDTGTVAWRVPARVERSPDEGGETWGDGCYAGVAPLRDGHVNLWAVVGADEPAATDLDALRRRFADFHAPIPELLAAADPDRAFVTGLSWLAPLRRFAAARGDGAERSSTIRGDGAERSSTIRGDGARGPGERWRVLLGDAAHAMTPNLGQGACLALEDAAVLRRCLEGAGTGDALARYDRLRRPRTARLTRRARLAGLVAGLHGRVPTAVRDVGGRLVPTALTLRGLDNVVGWRPPD